MAERLVDMAKRIDHTGEKYGYLTVIETLWSYQGRHGSYLRCICDCGNETIKDYYHIKRNPNVSCGCKITVPYKASDETGQKFNRRTILEIIRGDGPAKARCKCECGNEIITLKTSVTTGRTKSCGCYQKERAINYNLKDYSGMMSNHGVEILYPVETDEKGTRPWMCRCSFCGELFTAKPGQVLPPHREPAHRAPASHHRPPIPI